MPVNLLVLVNPMVKEDVTLKLCRPKGSWELHN